MIYHYNRGSVIDLVLIRLKFEDKALFDVLTFDFRNIQSSRLNEKKIRYFTSTNQIFDILRVKDLSYCLNIAQRFWLCFECSHRQEVEFVTSDGIGPLPRLTSSHNLKFLDLPLHSVSP